MASTISSVRSTSPPKSAWPGVSTTLIRLPRNSTAVCLARMVMPFSRSRSIESMTRSTTSWLARKAPDWRSIASTSVVLPWSTCATMARLRRSSLIAGTSIPFSLSRVACAHGRPPGAGRFQGKPSGFPDAMVASGRHRPVGAAGLAAAGCLPRRRLLRLVGALVALEAAADAAEQQDADDRLKDRGQRRDQHGGDEDRHQDPGELQRAAQRRAEQRRHRQRPGALVRAGGTAMHEAHPFLGEAAVLSLPRLPQRLTRRR